MWPISNLSKCAADTNACRINDRDEHMHRHTSSGGGSTQTSESKNPDGNEIHTEGGAEPVCAIGVCVVCQSGAPSPALQLIDLSCTSLSFSISVSVLLLAHTLPRIFLQHSEGGLNEKR